MWKRVLLCGPGTKRLTMRRRSDPPEKKGRRQSAGSSTGKNGAKFIIFGWGRGDAKLDDQLEKLAKENTGLTDRKVGVVSRISKVVGTVDLATVKERTTDQEQQKPKKCDEPLSPVVHSVRSHGSGGIKDIKVVNTNIPKGSARFHHRDGKLARICLRTAFRGNLRLLEQGMKGNEGIRRKGLTILRSPQTHSKRSHGSDDKSDHNKQNQHLQGTIGTESASLLVLGIGLHCDDCVRKIRKLISRYKGVESVTIDETRDQVAVTGAVEMKELVLYLKGKLKRNVEVISTRKAEDRVSTQKKRSGGCQQIKQKIQENSLGNNRNYSKKAEQIQLGEIVDGRENDWTQPHSIRQFQNQNYGMESHQGYTDEGSAYHRLSYSYATQIFSDENPNACSIM